MTSAPPPDPMEVLVVDDDPDIRYTLRFLLEAAGYTVFEASDGQPALERLSTHRRGMVVVVDWTMPGMDGAAFLRALTADLPTATRHSYLLLTDRAQVFAEHVFPLALARALPTVGAQVVARPYTVDLLLAAIERAAAHLRSIERSGQAILPSPLARPLQTD
jgi:two-component system, NtrC family, response regulator HydG